MKQLYEVGEVVILQSRSKPEMNGEYIIESIDETCLPLNVSGKMSSYGYFLKGSLYSWAESALRKKHEPSQQSFKDLMRTLKSPQKVEWD